MAEILFARLDEMTAAVANLQAQITAIVPIDNANIIALSNLDASAGLLTQTAAATFTKRTLTGTAAQITVTNGSGAAGNPVISLPTAITLTGITLTGGAFVGPALGTPISGVATNLTGTAAALTAGTVTTNANLTGDVTSVGNATTLTNAPVIAKVLTGYVSGAGVVAATDSILAAIQKLNGNDATNANLTGVITSVGNATSIASQTGTGSKFVVDTSPTLAGTPLAPTAAVNTNTTQIATAAFVVGQVATATPLIDGTGAVGTSLLYARQDHVHPTDTTRQAADPQLFSNIPQNSKSAAYTTVLTDGEKHILHPSADTTARIFTIDSNANVAYPIGTTLTFINQISAGIVTISITTDTLWLAGAGTTGSRTLAANGIATAVKITSTGWIISGVGLT